MNKGKEFVPTQRMINYKKAIDAGFYSDGNLHDLTPVKDVLDAVPRVTYTIPKFSSSKPAEKSLEETIFDLIGKHSKTGTIHLIVVDSTNDNDSQSPTSDSGLK